MNGDRKLWVYKQTQLARPGMATSKDMPDPAIYRHAAQKVGVPIGRCLYVGENFFEVSGAIAAGMKAVLKPCPPGRDSPV